MSYHTKKLIRWRTYFIELVVVFIGVMSAFLLSNWGEDRQERELEQDYLMSINTDLMEDQQLLEENIQIMTNHKRMLD